MIPVAKALTPAPRRRRLHGGGNYRENRVVVGLGYAACALCWLLASSAVQNGAIFPHQYLRTDIYVKQEGLIVITDEASSYHNGGLFDRNGVPTTPHFWEELDDDGIREKDAWEAYNNGDLYRTPEGEYVRFDPKSGVGVGLGTDPDDGQANTVFDRGRSGPSSTWERVDE